MLSKMIEDLFKFIYVLPKWEISTEGERGFSVEANKFFSPFDNLPQLIEKRILQVSQYLEIQKLNLIPGAVTELRKRLKR